MDWQLVINRNREELMRIIVTLIASLGLADGGRLTSLPYYLHRKALHIVRAAEAALRRLIVIAAHELALRGGSVRKPRVSFTNFMLLSPLSADHVPSFTLIDPRKMFGQDAPEFGAFGPPYEEDGETVDRTPIPAASLGRRLLALKRRLTISTIRPSALCAGMSSATRPMRKICRILSRRCAPAPRPAGAAARATK